MPQEPPPPPGYQPGEQPAAPLRHGGPTIDAHTPAKPGRPVWLIAGCVLIAVGAAGVAFRGFWPSHEPAPSGTPPLERPNPLPYARSYPPAVTGQPPNTPAAAAPKIESTENGGTVVRYEVVPYPAYLPDLRPLTDKYPLPLALSMRKDRFPKNQSVNVVWEINVRPIDRLFEMGTISGYPDGIRAALERDLKSILAQKAAFLECHYYTGRDQGRFRIFYYWYQVRPKEAVPAHARSIVQNNPFLKFRDARYNCPETRQDAEAG